MAQYVFVDTWGYLSLYDTREPRHLEVKQYLSSLSSSQKLITTNFILDETFTLLFRRVAFTQAKTALESIRKSVAQSYLQIENITSQRFEFAIGLRLKYEDKPDISYTDLTSFVVMREMGIRNVITADEHFVKVGLSFERVP